MADVRKTLPIVSSDERDPIARLADGDSAGLVEDLKRALERDPDDSVVWLRLGAVYLAIGHLPEAESALTRSVELDGADVEARLLFADALSHLRKLDAAAFQLVQARRVAPRDARVHRQLGVVFLEKGLHDKAEASLSAAAELDPTDARTPFLRGLVCDVRKDHAAALPHYRRAVDLDPGSVDARCTLADAMAAMGELASAARELEAAQRLDRTSTRIAQNLEVLRRALRDLEAHRLLGKRESDLETSALVTRAQLKRAGHVEDQGERRVRYRSAALELLVRYDGDVIAGLTLVLLDPDRAARTIDEAFEVTVVSRAGRAERADLATAASLTFLREALGCPLTRASEVYASLLRDGQAVVWAGVAVSLRSVELGDVTRVGLDVSLA